jgi:hypothetical protein
MPHPVNDIEHILQGDRLKVEAGRCVIVSGHSLRVAVHHDGLKPGLPVRSKAKQSRAEL